jgi:hypothetical protein
MKGKHSMQNLTWWLSGGFARGYRTYILMGLAVLTVAVGWADGDLTTSQAIPALLAALGLPAAANHDQKKG